MCQIADRCCWPWVQTENRDHGAVLRGSVSDRDRHQVAKRPGEFGQAVDEHLGCIADDLARIKQGRKLV
jgi:hypothetical protein